MRRAHGRPAGARSRPPISRWPRRSRSTSSSRSGPRTRGREPLRDDERPSGSSSPTSGSSLADERHDVLRGTRRRRASPATASSTPTATIGQIEAVVTLEQFRNRGLARATVSRALAASRGGRQRPDLPHGSTATTGRRSSTGSSASTRSAGSTSSSRPGRPRSEPLDSPVRGMGGPRRHPISIRGMRRSTTRHVIPALALGSALAVLPLAHDQRLRPPACSLHRAGRISAASG